MKGSFHIVRVLLVLLAMAAAAISGYAQGGDRVLQAEADALFEKGEYGKAFPMYSQLVSLSPQDRELNYKYGACSLYGGGDKSKAIGYLKFAVGGPATPSLAWYFLGRAYQLDYQFDEAISAYKHYRGTADKKLLPRFPVDALEQQCRNGKYLLSNLKDIEVLNKVEVDAADFFRFYDLSNIGGKIVVTPQELLSGIDRKSGEAFLTYLPTEGGIIYFSSYGKDGRTGRDIYRSELLPTGGYAPPVKLAGYINTDLDEDYAVMSSDGRTFYFCSKGHNSMGGYDVFRSTYDKGMDVFGAPENMDFAVNTPADELLYIVGPDGKQACFASNRDSKQGMVNVYRVGTTQTPINITVLKGTYASAFDPSDRRARIIVEDDLTRERVADVITDSNGEYVLALPRGGKYKVLVEGGPGGRSHLGTMEIPSTHKPTAFKQEIKLVERGGEKVDVTNHFDQPLDEDVMALALDEIRRRAKLNVTGEKAIAETTPQVAPSEDPLQAAGFDGSMTISKAMDLAAQEAEALSALAIEQEQEKNAALALALENLSTAEAENKRAAALVKQADTRTEEAEKANLMREAAVAKQLSVEAGTRARAAYQTGTEAGEAAALNRKRAGTADALSAELIQAQALKDRGRTTTALKQLKADIDARKGPEARVDELERTRRVASAAATEAARKMRQATALREDENILLDRVGRLAREVEIAKGRKKEDLGAQLATLEQQRSALHDEVEKAYTQARAAEEAAALARGQVELLRYLGNSSDTRTAKAVEVGSVAGIEQRLSQVREVNQALVIDPQYNPINTASAEERERRTFNWTRDQTLASTTSTVRSSGTQTQANVTPSSSSSASTGSMELAAGSPGQDNAETRSRSSSTIGTTDQVESMGQSQGVDGLQNDIISRTREEEAEGNAVVAGIVPTPKQQDGQGAGTDTAAGGAVQAGARSATGADSTPVRTERQSVASDGALQAEQARGNGPITGQVGGTGSKGSIKEEAVLSAEAGASVQVASAASDEAAFLMANRLAELEQLRQGEKDRTRKDSLDLAITDQKAMIAAFQAKENATQALAQQRSLQHMHEYVFLEFDMSIMDEELAEEAYPGFSLRRKAIMEGPATAREKASMLHALEMQLVDSIDVQTAKVLAFLEEHPQQAEELLPRLERWRQLKAAHVESAAEALAEVDQEYAATETKAMEDAQLSEQAAVQGRTEGQAAPETPHNDSYIALSDELDQVYASPLQPRSSKAADAVAQKDRDLQIGEDMQLVIDSLQIILSETPAGKNYDKLRQQVDRKIDDMLIHNVDLGQRLAFISQSEYAVAKDSAKVLTKSLAKQGFAPDAPLMQMSKSYVEAGDASMSKAKSFRKQADDAGDIFKRNSLYRQAYAEELNALLDYDRSHTVRNYLLSGQATPGEALTYQEVEQRMFPAAFANSSPSKSAPTAGRSQQTPATQEPAKHSTGETVTATTPTGSAPNSVTDNSAQESKGAKSEVIAAAGSDRERATTGTALVGVATERADSLVLSSYLDNYYYLNAQERNTVMGGEEERKYFMMKGRSMQERAEAAAIRNEADGAETLAQILRDEASALRDGPQGQPENGEQVQKLETRADAFILRSDSLHTQADQLITSSTLNDGQAATLMQGMPADRSAAIMDLEQGKRRTEPLLARTRPRPSSSSTTATRVSQQQAQVARSGDQTEQAATTQATQNRERLTAMEPAADPVQNVNAQAQVATPVAIVEEPTRAEERPTKEEERIAIVNVESPERTAPEEAPVAGRREVPGRMVGVSTPMDRSPVPYDKPLARNVFQFEEYATPREEAIPIDAPMPVGVVYKVQVGAFRNELPLEAFSDMTPVAGEHAGNGLVRYTAGMFTSAESASEAGKKVRDRGYRDAFVVAYMDGKRVPLREAMQAERALLAQNNAPSSTRVTAPTSASTSTPVATSVSSTVGSSGTTSVGMPEPAITNLPQPSPGTVVLADYPATAQEILAAFKPSDRATEYYNDPTAAPAKQVEAVKGLFFTVQVGVYSKPTPLDRLFNITPLNSELTANDKIRYTTGIFMDEGQAVQRKNGTVALGVTDAFVTAYLNGKRIPIRDARALLAKFGRDVLVDPGLVTP